MYNRERRDRERQQMCCFALLVPNRAHESKRACVSVGVGGFGELIRGQEVQVGVKGGM